VEICVQRRRIGEKLGAEVVLLLSHTCFKPFCFTASCQYTLLNLRPLVLGLTTFGRLRSVTLTPTYTIISGGNIIYDLCLLHLRPIFSGKQTGRKTNSRCK
jgi:hypothetical protein